MADKYKKYIDYQTVNTIDIIDEETRKIIQKFQEEEIEVIKEIHQVKEYGDFLKIFSKGKSVEDLCTIIKMVYQSLKSKQFVFEDNYEIKYYVYDEGTAKLIICACIDALNTLSLQLNITNIKDKDPTKLDPMAIIIDRNETKKTYDKEQIEKKDIIDYETVERRTK